MMNIVNWEVNKEIRDTRDIIGMRINISMYRRIMKVTVKPTQ